MSISVFKGGNYSREETIQGRKLYEEIRYVAIQCTYWPLKNSRKSFTELPMCHTLQHHILDTWYILITVKHTITYLDTSKNKQPCSAFKCKDVLELTCTDKYQLFLTYL